MKKGEGVLLAGMFASAFGFTAAASAQDGAALFASKCAGCHDGVIHPRGLVFNAAGNAAIIEAVIAKGMAVAASSAELTSIASYLDSIKPTINARSVAHDSPGTTISVRDIIVSGASQHADWKIINQIATVSPPKRGTVTYTFVNGFDVPSTVKYTPFPGQSGIDTWTYQGTGSLGSTTVRTASVNILNADGTTSTAPDLNQHGLTGSWYEPATSGQGVEVEIFPDLAAPGTGVAQVSWFTFDATAGGADHQRWYTLGGQVGSGQPSAALTIYRNTGGNFVGLPITTAQAVGTASLSFDTCATGSLSYTFTDGSGRTGSIPLTRLTKNVTCDAGAARPTNADFALSGNWFDPVTSGQGITVEVNPSSNALFFAWYTYAPNGAAAGAAGQRWYTGLGNFAAGARSVAVQLYETTGGVFNAVTPAASTVAVGTGTIAFQGCAGLTLAYAFTSGSMSGKTGTQTLQRVGPVPAGCLP